MPDDNRMRVLRIIARMNVGGPALQVAALANGLPKDRFDHRILVGEVGEGEEDYLALRAPDVQVEVISGLGRSPNPIGDVRAWFALIREMRRFRPDIVHTHTAKAGLLGRTAAAVTRVPCTVHTFHGHLLHGYFSPWITKAIVVLERLLALRTTALVAVGSKVRDELLAVGIGTSDQFSVIPPGISLPESHGRDVARSELGLTPEALVVAFVCRLTAIKRPDRMVAIARLVGKEVPEAVFIIVGEGDLIGETKTAAHDLKNVRFVGWRSDVENIYAAADLVLLTSDNEGMPVSLIEAAACGRAVVATDVGSVREVVLDGETGILCPPDAAPLAAAVCLLLTDAHERSRMESAALAQAEHFTKAQLVSSYESLYEKCRWLARGNR